jgi:prepilin-type N-terminal cleavage/methylation domain-containing protein
LSIAQITKKNIMHKTSTTLGFTLLEVLLTMLIITILSVSAIGYYRSSIVEVAAETTIKSFVADINAARGRAMAGDRGMSWGVRAVAPGSWVLFASATPGVIAEDFVSEQQVLSSGLSWLNPSSGSREVLFAPITGLTNAATFSLGYDSVHFQIAVTSGGAISVTRL